MARGLSPHAGTKRYTALSGIGLRIGAKDNAITVTTTIVQIAMIAKTVAAAERVRRIGGILRRSQRPCIPDQRRSRSMHGGQVL